VSLGITLLDVDEVKKFAELRTKNRTAVPSMSTSSGPAASSSNTFKLKFPNRSFRFLCPVTIFAFQFYNLGCGRGSGG
jgi:hypothetical protein